MSGYKDDNKFIAVWRGISVIIVVWHHFTTRIHYEHFGSDQPPIISTGLGKLGVLIFFVISGYLIAKSLENCRSASDFYAKRLSRIWPLFVVATVLIYFVQISFDTPVVFDGPKPFNTEELRWFDPIFTAFFLKDLGFRFSDGVFWSVLVEVKFYFLIGLLVVFFKQSYARWFCIIAIGVSAFDMLIILGAAVDHDIKFAVDGPLSWVSKGMHGLLIAQYLPLFALGVGLFTRQSHGILTILFVLSCLTAMIGVSGSEVLSLAVEVKFAFAMVLLLAVDHWVLNDRVFLFLGKYSYSLYLFHQIIGLTIISALVPSTDINIAILIAFLVTLSISIFASHLIEWRYRRQLAFILRTMFDSVLKGRLQYQTLAAENGKRAHN